MAAVVVALACSHDSGVAASAVTTTGQLATAIATEIRQQLEPEQAEVGRLYVLSHHTPLWIDERGRAGTSAHRALALLAGSSSHGLSPADYQSARLASLAAHLERSRSLNVKDSVRFELALSAHMLRFLRHLHRGRVDPRDLGLRLQLPAETVDRVVLLRRAVESGQVDQVVDDVSPPFGQYVALRGALARYRLLASEAGPLTEGIPPVALVPHDLDEDSDALERMLRALGDLPRDAQQGGDGHVQVVEGVKRFQARHGLDPDGVVGKGTRAAISVPVIARVRQIELALERLRWLPYVRGERVLVLNIPMFELSAWDDHAFTGAPRLSMRAIVGRARRTPTPVLSHMMKSVIFRPYWNVPASILHGEILPQIESDQEYLDREDMEIVRSAGHDASPVAASEENIASLARGELGLRQRPGPGNALGLIKFVFPNEENVYLHGTPTQKLFARSRRDFSHGCVRVEDPGALAEWVLEGEFGWDGNRIRAAMSDTNQVSRGVLLTRSIRVFLLYSTAAVMADGSVHFADDLYGHDERLDKALDSRQPSRR